MAPAAEFPLACDRLKRTVTLPEGADSFIVYRVPGAAGGKPKAVQSEGFPLEVPLTCSEEGLLEIVQLPGRYRLDVTDKDGAFLKVSCWVTLKLDAGQAPQVPPPQSALEASVIDVIKTATETNRLWSAANSDMGAALAGRVAGVKRLPVAMEDNPETIREMLETAIARGGGEEEVSSSPANPEDVAKQAENFKIWAKSIVDVLADNGPKAMPIIEIIKSWLATNKKLPPPGPNGVAS